MFEIHFFDGERIIISKEKDGLGGAVISRTNDQHDELMNMIKRIYSCTCKETANKQVIELLCNKGACAPWVSQDTKEALAEVYAISAA